MNIEVGLTAETFAQLVQGADGKTVKLSENTYGRFDDAPFVLKVTEPEKPKAD